MLNKTRARSPRSILPLGCMLVAVAVLSAAPGHVLSQPAYESVFEGYQSFRGQRAPIGWREANATAGELGGFEGQTRASPRPASAAIAGAEPTLPASRMSGMAEMMGKHRGEGRR